MATDSANYYTSLGLNKNASQEEIRKAYRKLARKYHPDVNPDNEDAARRFKEINEANEVLGDPENRKKYDKYGKDWQHADQIEAMRQQQGGFGGMEGMGGMGGAGFDPDAFDLGGLSGMFENLFGGRSFNKGRPSPRKGQDLQAELVLTLAEGYDTHKRTLNIQGKQIRINVPAGVEDGQVIRLSGHGQPGQAGAPAGDLYLTYKFEPDTRFERKGDDLHTQIHVDLFSALLGGEQEIETLAGPLRLKIKPGVQNGSKLRLKGKGYPVYKQADKFGDLFVEIKVDLPTSLSEEETRLVEQWSQLRKSKV